VLTGNGIPDWIDAPTIFTSAAFSALNQQ